MKARLIKQGTQVQQQTNQTQTNTNTNARFVSDWRQAVAKKQAERNQEQRARQRFVALFSSSKGGNS